MRSFLLISLLFVLAIGGGNQTIMAQQGSVPPLKTGNYLTIGAFHIERNAINFKNYVNSQGKYQAEIGYLPKTDYNYVYVKTYDNATDGYPDVWDFRENTSFDDTWVFSTINGASGVRDHIHARNGYKFYLTVGTFANRDNAIKFLEYVKTQGAFDPHVIYSPYTEYFYIYVNTYPSFPEGSPSVFSMRKQTEYFDTWLFSFREDELIPEGIVTGSMQKTPTRVNNPVLTEQTNSSQKTRVDQIVARARERYPQLTDTHEEEMREFLTTGGGKDLSSSHSLLELVSLSVDKDPTWTPDQELDLDQLISATSNPELDPGMKISSIDFEQLKEFKAQKENEGKTDTDLISDNQDIENVEFNVLLSNLNLEGETLNALNKNLESGDQNSRLTKVAEMVATARREYEILSDDHEDEMFEFLTEDLGQFINSTDDFVKLVDIAVNLKDWHRELPLDLAKALLDGRFKLTDPVADSVMKANAERVEVDVVPPTYEEDGKYQMFFDTYFAKTGDRVNGPIQVIDPVRLKQMSIEQSLSVVYIPDPNNQNESIQVIANIFGYKKVQHDFKMSEPFDSLSTNFLHFKGDVLMVDFPLQRYDVGEIATMYNVYYFKDAAIMKPESQFEIQALQAMLEENPNLKIRIHGHTNGKAPGKIIRVPAGEANYFSLENTDEGYGSSKQLSEERANVIKTFLVDAGISPDRMEVTGWGGKRPIYDKFDRRALKNVRVEIEILEN